MTMKMRSFTTATALVALALGGCASVPNGVTPAVETPASWNNVMPVAVSATAPAGVPARPVPARWWESFGGAELGRLIARAHRDNPDLAAAAQRISQATARARAAGAGLLPGLDASGSSSRGWPGEGRPSSGFQAGLDASYEVDLWGLNRANLEASEALAVATGFDRDVVALSLDAEIAATYFQYLNLHDRLANAHGILDIAERVLELVEKKAELGAASGLEVAQQRAAVASLRANVPTLEQRRAETLNALAQLLGTTAGGVVIRATSLDGVRLPVIAPGLPSDLLARRPDLRRAEASLAAARADVRVARAAMMPSIRLTSGAGYASTELSSLFSPAGFLANLAGGLAAPIFDGGRLAAQRDQAVAGEAEAVDAYRAAVIAAFRDVEDALAAIEYLAEIEAAQRQALAEAERAYELAEIRYRAGSTDFLTLLETQRSLFQQEDTLEQTRLARLSAAVSLYRALGGGWCEDGCGVEA